MGNLIFWLLWILKYINKGITWICPYHRIDMISFSILCVYSFYLNYWGDSIHWWIREIFAKMISSPQSIWFCIDRWFYTKFIFTSFSKSVDFKFLLIISYWKIQTYCLMTRLNIFLNSNKFFFFPKFILVFHYIISWIKIILIIFIIAFIRFNLILFYFGFNREHSIRVNWNQTLYIINKMLYFKWIQKYLQFVSFKIIIYMIFTYICNILNDKRII